jgi:hypothetical protein
VNSVSAAYARGEAEYPDGYWLGVRLVDGTIIEGSVYHQLTATGAYRFDVGRVNQRPLDGRETNGRLRPAFVNPAHVLYAWVVEDHE